jgi:hypothetical protein
VRILSWIAVSLAGFPSVAGAAVSQPVAPFTSSDLIRLIESHQAETPEEVLALLPPDFRRNVTFVFRSASLQQADQASPRAILWDEQGRFVLTLNGNDAQKGHQAFEIMQGDPTTDQLHFYKIDFPLKRDLHGKTQASLNEPAECLACHGRNPRPIWKEYPIWEGVYGSKDDTLPEGEKADYEKFLVSARNHPVYRNLVPGEKDPEWSLDFPYRPDENSSARRMETGFGYRTNLRLSSFLTRMNVRRLARVILGHPKNQQDTEGFLRRLMTCAGERPAQDYLPEFGLTKADFDISNPYYSPANQELDFNDSYFDGSATTNEYLTALLLEKLVQTRPSLTEIYGARGLMNKYKTASARNMADWPLFRILDQESKWFPLPYLRDAYNRKIQKRELFNPSYRSQYERVCDVLKSGTPSVSPESIHLAELNEVQKPADQLLKENCASCHSGGDAPFIPFDRLDELKTKVLKDGKPFIDKVSYRLDPATSESLRMPLASSPLSTKNRETVMEYLNKFSVKN